MTIIIIGTAGCRPCERLKAALEANGTPFTYYDCDEPDGWRILQDHGISIEEGFYPVVIKDGMVLPPMTKDNYLRSLR